jgi:hypothetical protein
VSNERNRIAQIAGGGVGLVSIHNHPRNKSYGEASTIIIIIIVGVVVQRAGELVAGALSLPGAAGPVLFALGLGGGIYLTTPRQLDTFNTWLCAATLATFVGLLALSSDGLEVRERIHYCLKKENKRMDASAYFLYQGFFGI